MFWDGISAFYDLFEISYNRKVIEGTAAICASLMDREDKVLECACGTGLITVSTAPLTKSYIATDFSSKMLSKCKKKMSSSENVLFENADITSLKYNDGTFDKVIAGNVIHLLDDPKKALDELKRVTKPGGMLIIPTYLTGVDKAHKGLVGTFNKMGANFKRTFDMEEYKEFFANMGFNKVEYITVEGRMPCSVAVIRL